MSICRSGFLCLVASPLCAMKIRHPSILYVRILLVTPSSVSLSLCSLFKNQSTGLPVKRLPWTLVYTHHPFLPKQSQSALFCTTVLYFCHCFSPFCTMGGFMEVVFLMAFIFSMWNCCLQDPAFSASIIDPAYREVLSKSLFCWIEMI